MLSNVIFPVLCLTTSCTAAAEAFNHTLEHLDPKLSKYLDGNQIRVDGKPRASGVLDTVRFWYHIVQSLAFRLSPRYRSVRRLLMA